jgi:hypothetical protein
MSFQPVAKFGGYFVCNKRLVDTISLGLLLTIFFSFQLKHYSYLQYYKIKGHLKFTKILKMPG